jgi:3'-phosphoadenosine 5'-phosphosulfate sulfotransferase (PAPS reductase)/FAD synthetase
VIDDSEQRVESMTAEGLRIIAEAVAEFKPVAIMAAYSSGDDSSVSTHFSMEHVPGCFVFNADTMVGLAPSRAHLHAVCERFKWPVEVRKAFAEGPPQKTLVDRADGSGRKMLVPFNPAILPAGKWTDGATAYEEMVLNHGFPGPGMHPLAYRRLKEQPIRRLLREYQSTQAGKRVLIISGIRHDESSRRAGYQRAVAAGHFGDVWVNPFYWRTAVDFEAYRQEFGIPRNPVKKQCGISGECCCGAFGNAAKELADYLSGLIVRVAANGFPWSWAERPPQWWLDSRQGQGFLFGMAEPGFQPMCVGCNNGRR